MRKYIWIVHVFYSARSESTHTSQATMGNKRVTIDICTTHKHEWLFFSSWSILWHLLTHQRKKKCCPLSVWLQKEPSLHGMSFRSHRKQTAWPIVMAWPHFSCRNHGAKELAWMLKGAVLLCQQPHCHGRDGVTAVLPAGFLQGAEEQDGSVGWCTLGGLSTGAGFSAALCYQQLRVDVLRAACWQRKQYDKN